SDDIAAISDYLQKIVPQTIFDIPLIAPPIVCDRCSVLLFFDQSHHNQASSDLNRLPIGNRVSLLVPSWQNTTLIERLYGKWNTPPIPSQYLARNFWNQKNSSDSYAMLGLATNPIRQKQVKESRKISNSAFSSAFNICCFESDRIGRFALWLPASAF